MVSAAPTLAFEADAGPQRCSNAASEVIVSARNCPQRCQCGNNADVREAFVLLGGIRTSQAVQELVTSRSDKNGDACGCALGAKVMFAVLIVSLVALFRSGHRPFWALCRGIGACFLLALLGSVTGKIVGIWRYRIREARLARTATRIDAVTK
jgi:hypothetical protein